MTRRGVTIRNRAVIGLAVSGFALSGCGAGHLTGQERAGPKAPRTVPSSAAPAATATSRGEASRPSPSALMICSAETRHNLATLLGERQAPATTTSWANHVYTCVYHLRRGPLVLSVQEAGSLAAGRRYYNQLRADLGATHALTGAQALGLAAYESDSGSVVFLKDDKTLQVDASRLPRSVGAAQRTRSDLAYTLATDVMGCWAGD